MNLSRQTSLSFGAILAAAGILTLGGAQAHADLQFTAPTVVGNLYTYDLNFSNSIDGGTGLPAQRLQSGNFATLYDIAGITSTSLNPAFASMFTLTQQTTGITAFGTAPTDGALPNLTVTYTGPTVTADQSFAGLLHVNSTFTTVNTRGQYTGETTKNAGAAAGTPVGAIGFVSVPGTTAATPEPGSLALLVGAGLSGSVFAFRRRRNRK